MHLLPGHLPMVPIAGVGGFHRAQHVAFDTRRSFQAEVAGTPEAGRLQDVTRLSKVIFPMTIARSFFAEKCSRGGITHLGPHWTSVHLHGQAGGSVTMEVSCRQMSFSREGSVDAVNPSAILHAASHHSLRTLWHVILHRRGNSPGDSSQHSVISLVIVLHPEAELQGVLQGLISPRNRLICIQQRPHMVTCDLPATVVSKITSGILHRQ
mmetsp:Transcript_45649/g.72472  ORF Transcript_45649/g.72472 Transcript_45649/m.72472 type:complete len:210 (+) Transcript_45649:180-809(+)